MTYSFLYNAGKPVWVAFTLEDSSAAVLRSGEPLAAAAQSIIAQSRHVEAVLVNCCHPSAALAAIGPLAAVARQGSDGGTRHVRIGAYANGFKTTTTQWLESTQSAASPLPGAGGADTALNNSPAADVVPASRAQLEIRESDYDVDGLILPQAYLRYAKEWSRQGGEIVGGCCGIGPAHIAALGNDLAGKARP